MNAASFVSSRVTLSDYTKLKLIKTRKSAASLPVPSRVYPKKSPVIASASTKIHLFFPQNHSLLFLTGVLFSVVQSTSGRAQSLISHLFTDWKDAVSILNVHSGLEFHLTSEAISHPDKSLDVIFPLPHRSRWLTASQEQVAKNRAILTSIIKCVESCGHGRTALRGHKDDSTSTDISQGNFKALVKFFLLILVMKFSKAPKGLRQ